jgi:hypothetical protein
MLLESFNMGIDPRSLFVKSYDSTAHIVISGVKQPFIFVIAADNHRRCFFDAVELVSELLDTVEKRVATVFNVEGVGLLTCRIVNLQVRV